MAGNPVQPEEHARNRKTAGDLAGRIGQGRTHPVMKIYRRTTPDMKIDKFKPAIVYAIYIASTPEKVWQALTSAEFSRKYFFDNAVEVDQKVGGTYIVRTPDGALHISGEVIEYDPPRKLTVTFNVSWPALVEKLGPTLVTYEIEQAG